MSELNNATVAMVAAAQAAAAAASPVSCVKFFPANTVPTGWLKANGAAISRTAYAALFAAIGTAYGVGDGSTTFNLPDLRGEFLRCFDDARGVDVGRGIGTAQAGDVQSHNHSMYAGTIGNSAGAYLYSSATDTPYGLKYNNATGGTETRPRNVALLACIKY